MKYILIVVILAVVVGGGILLLSKEKTELPEGETPEGAPTELALTIDIPKTSFVTGEQVEGKYIVKNKGKTFNAYIFENCVKEGYEKYTCHGRGISFVGTYSGSLKACEPSLCLLDSFRSPGTYIYELAVYDCDEIKDVLGVECNKADYDEVTTQVQPLSATKKTVTVTGETITTECRASDECTQTCEGCVKGKYICVLPKGECVQCFMKTQCKSGYNCESGECIKTEKTCTEYGGVDCPSGCFNGEFFRATDTNYCCTGSCL